MFSTIFCSITISRFLFEVTQVARQSPEFPSAHIRDTLTYTHTHTYHVCVSMCVRKSRCMSEWRSRAAAKTDRRFTFPSERHQWSEWTGGRGAVAVATTHALAGAIRHRITLRAELHVYSYEYSPRLRLPGVPPFSPLAKLNFAVIRMRMRATHTDRRCSF